MNIKASFMGALCLIAWPASALGQNTESESPRCLAYVAELESRFDVRHGGPLDRIDRCYRSAPPFLARMWALRLDETEARRLAYASAQFRDARILRAALRTAAEGAFESPQRIAAMQTAALYLWPGLSLETEWLEPTNDHVMPTKTTATFVYRLGTVRHTNEDLNRVVDVVGELVADHDDLVAYAAGRLHPYLTRRAPM